MSELPNGWHEVPFEVLGDWGSGGTPKRTNPDYYQNGTIPWLVIGDLNDGIVTEAKISITEKGLANSSAKLLPKDTLLIAMYGSIGKLGITGFECATNQAIAYCRPYFDLVNLKYLFYSAMNEKEALLSQGQGGAQQNISQTILKAHQISLAPLNEQRRIVDKLDATVARVDTCRARLDRVGAILKRFRQAVLAAAVSGKLTEEWREENGATEEWADTDIQSVAHVGTGSTPLRSNSTYFSADGTPWITSAATSQEIVMQAEEYVTEAAISAHRLKTFPVGTLLVAMYGEGKTRGQVTELGIKATINQACAAVVVDESRAIQRFIKLVLQANYLEMRILAEGGNQPNLNLSKIKEFPLHLPPPEEQAEIVRRVETLFAFASRLETSLATGNKRLMGLTPALLAKAFRGELVPQDPSDEPADALLERIRAARESAGAGGGKRGRKPRETAATKERAARPTPEPGSGAGVKRGRGRPRNENPFDGTLGL